MNENETFGQALCSICGQPIHIGSEELCQHRVIDWDGTLDYIELAHASCAEGDPYWQESDEFSAEEE